MIRIAISPAAFEAIAATCRLSLGPEPGGARMRWTVILRIAAEA
jgi:hypothetical protein